MSTSNSEKCKKYREKRKADPDFLTRERERIKLYREKKELDMTVEEKNVNREKERIRKRIYRKIQATKEEGSGPQTPYSSKKTLGKAISRSFHSLPSSPRKQKSVVAGLAKKVGLRCQMEMEDALGKRIQDDELVKCVNTFYFRPDISYTMPGMKDEITLWVDGKKTKERKYYITMFLREAHAIFSQVYPDHKIGFSKFCELRPRNVLLLHQTPMDQCKCKIHENFILRLKGLKIVYSSQSYWKNVLCDATPNSKCWQSQCNVCSDGKLFSMELDPNSTVTWKEWESVEKDSHSILKLNVFQECAAFLLDRIKTDMNIVLDHINTKRIQAQDFEDDKSNENVRVLEMDFAMNYSCEYQSEIQSALWSRASVMLFTAALIREHKVQTFLVCSDSRDKNKDTVYKFVDSLYENIFANEPGNHLDEIIWTDGPSSEFKNRFMVKLLVILANKYNKNFTWKYFATSHGKGIVDGIGGRAKSIVRTSVTSKNDNAPIVQDSIGFFKTVSNLMPTTKIFHISQGEIDSQLLKLDPWTNVFSVAGIKKMHVINYDLKTKVVKCWKNALESEPSICLDYTLGAVSHKDLNKVTNRDTSDAITATTTADCSSHVSYKIGDWVVVMYDGSKFPGEVTVTKGGDIEVSVMHPSGATNYRWPEKIDKIFYRSENIIKKIEAPLPVGSRGQFKFVEI